MNNKVKNIVTTAVFVLFIGIFALLSVIKGFNPTDYSNVEKRPMAQFPTGVTWEQFLNNKPYYVENKKYDAPIKQFENFTVDQFPLREFFRYLKAHFTLDILGMKENNGYAVEEGSITTITPAYDDKNIQYSLSALQGIVDKYLKDHKGNSYVAVIPDKNYFFGTEYNYPMPDYEALIEEVKQALPEQDYIDLFSVLTLQDYYKNDWHWDQSKLDGVLDALAGALGIDDRLPSADGYTVNTVPGFQGGYWAQSGLRPAGGEDMVYLTNDTINGMTLYDYATMKTTGVYVSDKIKTYDFFLNGIGGGEQGLQRIENPNAQNDDVLVVFRDSFGGPIVPLLAQGYRTVYVVDIRTVLPSALQYANIPFETADVLFLYSTTVLNTQDFQAGYSAK